MRTQIDKKYLTENAEIMYRQYQEYKDRILRQSYEIAQLEDRNAELANQVSDLLNERENMRTEYGNLYQYAEALEHENRRLCNEDNE